MVLLYAERYSVRVTGFVSDQCMYVCTYVHTCVMTVASDTAVCVREVWDYCSVYGIQCGVDILMSKAFHTLSFEQHTYVRTYVRTYIKRKFLDVWKFCL